MLATKSGELRRLVTSMAVKNDGDTVVTCHEAAIDSLYCELASIPFADAIERMGGQFKYCEGFIVRFVSEEFGFGTELEVGVVPELVQIRQADFLTGVTSGQS